MFIRISPSKPSLPLTIEDDLSPQQEEELLAQCPTIDLTKICSKEQVTHYLINLFAYYFQLPAELINESSDIVNDIERHVWARELGVSFKDVTYGRVFCGKDDEGNVTGGVEDRGMMIATMYMTDFPDLVGIKVIDDKQNATFEAGDDEFGSYYDCGTIDELAALVYSVCKKIPVNKSKKRCNKMTIFDKVDQVLSKQNATIFTTAEIKQLCVDTYGLNPSSVIPSDYCYNRTNNGIGTDKNILVYLGFGEFRYVGKSYQYEGWVFQKRRGESEDAIVGQWKGGQYYEISPRPFNVPEHNLREAFNLNKVQIEKLYQDYLELLEIEMNLLGCKATELRHLIGRIGEFKCALMTNGQLASIPNQHGFDVVTDSDKKISVKTTAQTSGFVSINSNTIKLVDELMLIQFKNNGFSVVYHGPVQPAIEAARIYGNKYELDITKASKLKIDVNSRG